MHANAKVIFLASFLAICFGLIPAESLSPPLLDNNYIEVQNSSISTHDSSTQGDGLPRRSVSDSPANTIPQKINLGKIEFERERASKAHLSEQNAGQVTQGDLNTVADVYSCDLAPAGESCCLDESHECLYFSFTEVLIDSDIPTETLKALDFVSSSNDWIIGSTPFQRSIGYCLRSRLYEFCFDQDSHKIVVYDWIRSSEGKVEISNPREFDTKLFAVHN
jgi:hypothetical protein